MPLSSPRALGIWQYVEVDAGTSAVEEASMVVVDSTITATTFIVGGLFSGVPPSGMDADEAGEMDFFLVNFIPEQGQFTIRLRSLDGPISGKFNVYYSVGR